MNLSTYPVPTWISKDEWNKYIINEPWKVKAIIKSGYKCQDCGDSTHKLIITRINNLYGNEQKNLIVVCHRCHAKRRGLSKTGKSFEISNALQSAVAFSNGNIPRGLLTKIANKFGVSRERVRQIAKKDGYIPVNKAYKEQKKKKCKICGKNFYASNKKQVCCSPECYKQYRDKKYWTTKPCKNCGKPIKFRKALVKLGKEPIFCGKMCFGAYMGKTYGWGTREKRTRAEVYGVKEIKKRLPEWFTVKDFKNIVGFKSTSGAYFALIRLVKTKQAVRKPASFPQRGHYYRILRLDTA